MLYFSVLFKQISKELMKLFLFFQVDPYFKIFRV